MPHNVMWVAIHNWDGTIDWLAVTLFASLELMAASLLCQIVLHVALELQFRRWEKEGRNRDR